MSHLQNETTIFTVMSRLAKEYNAINLGQGFPNFRPHQNLLKLINEQIHISSHQYAPMAGSMNLRNALAQKLKICYNKTIDPVNEITITAGATQGLFTIFQAFLSSDDEVIIFDPAYDSYAPSIHLAGAKAIRIELEGDCFSIPWQKVIESISSKTKMIVINNPHNPSGSILSKQDLETLNRLCEKHNILVLSDEVYEHLIYDNQKHQSVLLYSDLYQRSLAVFSFGKSFHATGWKLGYVIAPSHLSHAFRNVHQWNVFSVNSFLQEAIAGFLSDSSQYLDLALFYEKKRNLLLDGLVDSKFKATKSKGSYFQLFDYSQISSMHDVEFAKWLTIEYGITGIPLSPFYENSRNKKLIRFCFAKTEEVLKKAIQILQQVN